MQPALTVDGSSLDTTVPSVVDLSLVFIVDIMIDVAWYVVSLDSDVDWSLEASNEDVGVFIWFAEVISVDIPVECRLDEGVNCATVNEE